jgi:hypothetical protein
MQGKIRISKDNKKVIGKYISVQIFGNNSNKSKFDLGRN